jgi:nitrogen permease regulator 3-like protein
VRKYAQHFIYWRRAIAIPPLHARDMYIMSPNADTAKLPRAAADWSRMFPLAPPLPDFLAALSAVPKPYKSICPSKAYRPDYLRMLAWLMRGGWVTQLCTFAYVVVWPEIIYEVEYAMEAEEIAKAKKLGSDDAEAGSGQAKLASRRKSSGNEDREHSMATSTSTLRSGSDHSRLSRETSAVDAHPELVREGSAASGTVKPPKTAAEQAAEKARKDRMADKAARELAEKATAHARKAVPQATAHPSINHAPHLANMIPHLILDARKPNGKESRYLTAIGDRLRNKGNDGAPGMSNRTPDAKGKHHSLKPPGGAGSALGKGTATGGRDKETPWEERVADAWPKFWKYLDGRSALERIALQEDMKRKEVWNLLMAMSEYLLCARHW